MYNNQLEEVIKEIEISEDNFLMDQAAFVLAYFQDAYSINQLMKECPKLTTLFLDMDHVKEPKIIRGKLLCADWMDREDNLGRLCTLLIKAM